MRSIRPVSSLRGPKTVAALALLIAWMAACAPQVREAAPEPAPAVRQLPLNVPRSDYAQAAAQGQTVYRVDPTRSLVVITVRRGGVLARLGHDHVVASHAVQGYIAPEQGRADLLIPLDELRVDESALRTEAGLDTQPSAADIAGTRSNMLNKVLATQQFPFARIRVNAIEKLSAGEWLDVAITLRGVTRQFKVPVQTQTEREALNVKGSLEFKQSDFDIVPFAILGGALQVQDRLSLRFGLHARQGLD